MPDQIDELNVRLTNEKVPFLAKSKSNPDRPIVFDYKEPVGDGRVQRT